MESVPRTEKLRATVHQELELREIARDDVRYQIPINMDLLDDFSPEREFTRPKDVGFDLGQ